MGVVNYPWQHSVLDAFTASRNDLRAKIKVAERTVACRIQDPELDGDERIALGNSRCLLLVLSTAATPEGSKISPQSCHVLALMEALK